MTGPSPEEVFAQLSQEPGAVWLDGGNATTGWSIVSFKPDEIITECTDWRETGRRLAQDFDPGRLPFSGGVIGYIGYGAGAQVAPVPRQDSTWEPELWLGRYPGGMCYDHKNAKWHLAGSQSFTRRAKKLLAAATPLSLPEPRPEATHYQSIEKENFIAAVQRIHEWLLAGDCYQINLTRPVWLDGVGKPWPAYRRLRAHSAPKYGAFLNLESSLAVLSNSPELLLTYDQGYAASEPIKGTRPRGEHPIEDAQYRDALLHSRKDQAELTMIVDLVRNDLGKIAQPGTVKTSARIIQSHANVHHASRHVKAILRPDIDAWSALGALFPPGSVTGAPKIRACERINQLETHPRGTYCGAIGYASGSRACFNVSIRTAVWRKDQCRYHVGGGIVIDSKPMDEWWETVHKAAAMAQAYGAPIER